MNRRAQSEALGFVLIFSLIVATVGIVYVSGYGALQDSRDAEQVTNMERGFDVLADNVADVHRHGDPSRATELKLGGGTLRHGDGVYVAVDVTDTANASHNASYPSVTVRPLVYADGDSSVVYALGGVLRTDGDAAAVRSGPGWVLTPERSVVSLLVTYPGGGSTSLGGRSTVLVQADRQTRALYGSFDPEGDARVNVTVESARAGAWADYFAARGMTAVDGDAADGRVTYQYVTDVLYVTRTDISLTVTN